MPAADVPASLMTAGWVPALVAALSTLVARRAARRRGTPDGRSTRAHPAIAESGYELRLEVPADGIHPTASDTWAIETTGLADGLGEVVGVAKCRRPGGAKARF